jgi:hypothetical protein
MFYEYGGSTYFVHSIIELRRETKTPIFKEHAASPPAPASLIFFYLVYALDVLFLFLCIKFVIYYTKSYIKNCHGIPSRKMLATPG